jgi:3-oxoacyl-[acyl-carrier protein] reductase
MTNPRRSIQGSIALVTGAASGMGRATAILFGTEGAKVIVTDRTAEGADAVAREIQAAGGSARGWKMDVSSKAEIDRVVAEAAAHFGGLDIVVNNAGIAGFGALDSEGYDELWERMLTINVTAQQRVVRAALPFLRKSKAARIVNIASTEALGATPLDSAYVASKSAVAGLTRALAVDLGKEGIMVNAICPGPIETPMTSFATPEQKDKFARIRTALRRYGHPEEVAHMTLSLCLPAASYITGAVIPVDGGLMARNA